MWLLMNLVFNYISTVDNHVMHEQFWGWAYMHISFLMTKMSCKDSSQFDTMEQELLQVWNNQDQACHDLFLHVLLEDKNMSEEINRYYTLIPAWRLRKVTVFVVRLGSLQPKKHFKIIVYIPNIIHRSQR